MIDLQNLFERCRQGDRKSQRRLYDLFQARLMGLCRRYTRDREEAEDVLQESFIKIFAKFDQATSPEKLESWMKSVVVHTAINQYHRNKRRSDEPMSALPTEPIHIDDASTEYLLSIINNLPAKCRMVFNLYEIEGYSHSEIASMMEITESTSRSQLHYAKSLLQQRLHVEEKESYYGKLARG